MIVEYSPEIVFAQFYIWAFSEQLYHTMEKHSGFFAPRCYWLVPGTVDPNED